MTRKHPLSVWLFLLSMWSICSLGYVLGVIALSASAGSWDFVVSFLGGGVYMIANIMFWGDES